MDKHRLGGHCLPLFCGPKPLAYMLQHTGYLHLNLLALALWLALHRPGLPVRIFPPQGGGVCFGGLHPPPKGVHTLNRSGPIPPTVSGCPRWGKRWPAGLGQAALSLGPQGPPGGGGRGGGGGLGRRSRASRVLRLCLVQRLMLLSPPTAWSSPSDAGASGRLLSLPSVSAAGAERNCEDSPNEIDGSQTPGRSLRQKKTTAGLRSSLSLPNSRQGHQRDLVQCPSTNRPTNRPHPRPVTFFAAKRHTGGGGIQRQGIHRHGSIPRPPALWRGLGPVSGPVCLGHSRRSPGGGGSAQRPVVPSLPLSLQGPGSGPGLPKNVFAGVGGPWSPFSTPTPTPREGGSESRPSLFHVFHAYSMTKPLALSLSLCHSKRGGGGGSSSGCQPF